MFTIYDRENDEYYNATFETREDALDGLEELCYKNQWDSDWFTVVRVAA